MESVHNAIAWYQKKIGSYDKQLWEQSVERKLKKGLPNAHHAPRKTVRLKTEYIDVDLIRGSTFTKTKPQVPWIFITKKALVRVLFFPFYYRWWILQSSRKVFYLMLLLYLLQVNTAFIYFWNLDGSIIEDEPTLTEVVVPICLMFLLGLIHSQTVLAHFSLKPPRPRRDNRLGSKSKKRQRGSLGGEPSSDRGPGNRAHRTTSIWNVPRVEVSAVESPAPQPSMSPSLSRPSRQQKPSKRAEKKNVRIIDSSQKIASKTSLSGTKGGEIWVRTRDDIGESRTDGGRSVTSSDGAISEGFNALCSNSLTEKVWLNGAVSETNVDVMPSGSVGSKAETGLSGRGSQETVPDGCGSVALTQSAVPRRGVASRKAEADAADKDKSSSGFEDGCDSGAACEGEVSQGRNDVTTDSDTAGSRFEFVHLDERVSASRESVSSDDGSANANGVSALPGSQQVQSDQRSGSGLGVGSGSGSLEKVKGKFSLTRISEQLMTSGRSSFSEDCTTDHREEDNLSDTGHVSNSSNYNPSDSGSDADNGEVGGCMGTPIPKSPISSSTMTATTLESVGSATFTPSTLTSGAVGGVGSSGSLTSSPRKLCQQQLLEGESSASDQGSPDTRQSLTTVRRRRRISANQSSTEQADPTGSGRPRPLPPKLLGLRAQSKVTQTSGVSSSENEAGALTPEATNKATISSEEWEDRMQSDVTTSSSYSTSNSESELSENDNLEEEDEEGLAHDCLPTTAFHSINLLQPPTSNTNPANHGAQPDKVSCVIWEGNECKKLDLTALDIGWAIIDKVDNLPESSDYIFIGLLLSFCLGCVPFLFRLYYAKAWPTELSVGVLFWLINFFRGNSWGQNLIIFNGFVQRLALSCIFFFLLTVTDRTFKQRLLYAKHFSYLTSSRRARKFDMPHFRLNKVRNIKIWLSLRSYLKRRGPQRSVDVIVSASFYLSISLVCLMCIQMLKDSDTYLDFLCNWELVVWCLALGIYIMRFMTLGLKINKKYRNLSVLITEQINLYLQMEQKPHKKEELTLANNVLRLAEDLLKELESPFKISGFSANPLIYNITKVVVLSAFSAVMTEVLGFKLKLYKIKLK